MTERFNTGHYVPGVSWGRGGRHRDPYRTDSCSTTNVLEYLRQIDVAYHTLKGSARANSLPRPLPDGAADHGTADGQRHAGRFVPHPGQTSGAKAGRNLHGQGRLAGPGGSCRAGAAHGQHPAAGEHHHHHLGGPAGPDLCAGQGHQLAGRPVVHGERRRRPPADPRRGQRRAHPRCWPRPYPGLFPSSSPAAAHLRASCPRRALAAAPNTPLWCLCDDAETALSVAELGASTPPRNSGSSASPIRSACCFPPATPAHGRAHQTAT